MGERKRKKADDRRDEMIIRPDIIEEIERERKDEERRREEEKRRPRLDVPYDDEWYREPHPGKKDGNEEKSSAFVFEF
ncbi:MAG: hypothetical protein Kow0090_06820 [Myxococcota bacterium]